MYTNHVNKITRGKEGSLTLLNQNITKLFMDYLTKNQSYKLIQMHNLSNKLIKHFIKTSHFTLVLVSPERNEQLAT